MSPAGGVIIVAITTPGTYNAAGTSRCSLAESSCWKHREEDEGHARTIMRSACCTFESKVLTCHVGN